MPSSAQILAGLTEIANGWKTLAILWHAYFAVLAGWLIVRGRMSTRIFGILLGLPLASVSALAWLVGNPFNGMVFAIAGLSLVAVASRLPMAQVRPRRWAVVPGALMFVFGWTYPHFLSTTSYSAFLYSAPTGLLPCPTLSVIVGLAIATDGMESRAWSLVLGSTALFYGVFGAAVLGVALDWILMAGAALLLLIDCRRQGPRRAAPGANAP